MTSADNNNTRPRVMVVDDDTQVLVSIGRLLKKLGGYEVILASSPFEAISLLQGGQEVQVVVCDHLMPELTGVELLSLLQQSQPGIGAIMLTGCHDIGVAAEVVNRRLADFFLTKPWDSQQLLHMVEQAVQLQQRRRGHPAGELAPVLRLEAERAVYALARAVDARDSYTHSHSGRVAVISAALGRRLGLGEVEQQQLRTGGLLHDVGKIGIPDGVLLKRGALDESEFQLIRRHPEIGLSIVEPIGLPPAVGWIVSQHHENFDGSGYPRGLSGKDTSLLARIVRVVDAYEAMAADRVYRQARSPEWIREEFRRFRGSQFDPDVCDAFLAMLAEGPPLAAGTVVA